MFLGCLGCNTDWQLAHWQVSLLYCVGPDRRHQIACHLAACQAAIERAVRGELFQALGFSHAQRAPNFSARVKWETGPSVYGN